MKHSPTFIRAGFKGFSLIELMVVLSIAAILVGIGVPSFRTLIQNQRMTTTVNDFLAAINLTRSEALQRGVRVDMVPADAKSADWANGWTVFVDANSDQVLDASEKIIYTHGPIPDGMTIDASSLGSAPLYIAYRATGENRTGTKANNQKGGTVKFVLDGWKRNVILNFLGRPRVCDPDKEPTTCK